MATSTTIPSSPQPATVDPVVVLVDATSDTERDLITGWARDAYPQAELLDQADPGLALRLERGDDPLVVPARVTWLASGGAVGETSVAGDLRALLSPRRPPALLQGVIARRAPG